MELKAIELWANLLAHDNTQLLYPTKLIVYSLAPTKNWCLVRKYELTYRFTAQLKCPKKKDCLSLNLSTFYDTNLRNVKINKSMECFEQKCLHERK